MRQGWKEEKIGRVVIVGDGAHASIKRIDAGFLYLTSKNFTQNGLKLDKVEYISEEDYHKYFRENSKALTKPSIDDVLLSIIGTIGAPFLVKENNKYGLSSSVSILRANKSKLYPQFLYYWIKSSYFQQAITSIKSGVAQSFLSLEMIRSLPCIYPPLPIQKKIASILSAYDDLIENNLKRIKLLEEMAQQTYEEWFVRFRIDGKKLPLNQETGLPVGWVRKKIGDVVDFKSGYAFKSSSYFKEAKYKIVTIKNVQDGIFIPEVTDTINKKPSNLKDHHILKTGDIIMSLTGNVGRICLVYGVDYLLNQRVVKLSPKKEFYKSYIYCHFRSNHTLKILENISNGAAQQNLSPINASKQQFIVPSDTCLYDFNNLLSPCIKSISMFNIQNQLLKEARNILLPRLMTGMIDVEKCKKKGEARWLI